jgi:type III secretory pathway component EscR
MIYFINIILSLFISVGIGGEVRGYVPVKDIEYREVCISTECHKTPKLPLDPFYRRPKLPEQVDL